MNTATLTPFEQTVLDRINSISALSLARELNRTEAAVWAACSRAYRKIQFAQMRQVADYDRVHFPCAR